MGNSYLRRALIGEPKGLQTSDDRFFWGFFNALEQRYENKTVVDYHKKNILNMYAIKHEYAKKLRNFLDNVNRNLRALKVLDFDRDTFSNAILLNVILDKLDHETHKQCKLTLKDNEVPNFDELLELLECRYQI